MEHEIITKSLSSPLQTKGNVRKERLCHPKAN
jgi:hypothetical protein